MKFKDIFEYKPGILLIRKPSYRVNWKLVETLEPFAVLKKTKQSSVWHKEGNVFRHTKLVTEAMERLLRKMHVDAMSEYWIMMMTAALCHDLGKGPTTRFDEEKKDWACKRHGAASARIIRTIFQEEDFTLREKVCFLARHHMVLHHIFDKTEGRIRSLISLSLGPVTVNDMMLLKKADSLGSKNSIESSSKIEDDDFNVRSLAMKYNCLERPYSFKNAWHRMMFFAFPDKFSTPDEIIVPSESYNPKFTVYMMLGVPGAGKDWYIEHNLKGVPQISRDMIRSEIGLKGDKPQGNKEEEERVTAIFDERMKFFLENGISFIINNTNGNKRYRDAFIKTVLPYFPKVVYIYCEAPYLEMNYLRRKDMMPMKVITRMWNEFEFPHMGEYSEIVFNVQRENEKD